MPMAELTYGDNDLLVRLLLSLVFRVPTARRRAANLVKKQMASDAGETQRSPPQSEAPKGN